MDILPRIASAILCLFLLLPSLFACAPSGGGGTTSAQPGESTPPPPSGLDIFKDGKTDYCIVRKDERSGGTVTFCVQLKKKLGAVTGALPELKVDFYLPGESYSPDTPEILVGETNRPESEAAYALLAAQTGSRYSLSVRNAKLVIAGTDDYMIYRAIGYLFTELIHDGDLTLASDFTYTSDDLTGSYSPDALLESGEAFDFIPIKQMTTVPGKDNFTTLQGGGTDGEYAYYALISKETDPENAVIVKYDLDTWEIAGTSEPMPTAHSNDITYNSKLDKLIISYCHTIDGWRGISYCGRDLKYEKYQLLNVANRGIDYIPSLDRYVIGTGYTIYITDADFNVLSQFTCQNPQYTTQGLCSDGKYVYDVRYASSNGKNYIVVHDLTGNYKGTGTLDNVVGEPENIFRDGNYFYIGFNKTLTVWRTVILPADRDSWWS